MRAEVCLGLSGWIERRLFVFAAGGACFSEVALAVGRSLVNPLSILQTSHLNIPPTLPTPIPTRLPPAASSHISVKFVKVAREK